MKIAPFCILAAVLICGCKPKLKPALPQPARTTVPITNAFGWTLGETLPPEFTLVQGLTIVAWNTSTPKYEHCVIACLKDRTIYSITGVMDSIQGAFTMKMLESKYGPGGQPYDPDPYSEFSETWTNGDFLLQINQYKNTVSVTYENTALHHKHWNEIRDEEHRAGSNLVPRH